VNTENRLATTSTTHVHSAFNTFIAANGFFGALNIMEIVPILGFVMQEYVATQIKNVSVGM
jgi:hypothetical protein